MKKSHLLSGLAVAGSLVCASPAFASIVSVTVNEGIGISASEGSVNVSLSGTAGTVSGYDNYIGSFLLKIGGTDFTGFCLDLVDHLHFGSTYSYENSPSTVFDDFTVDTDLVKKFFAANYSSLGDPIPHVEEEEYAAFQVGLWELIYDGIASSAGTVASYFDNGNFKASEPAVADKVLETARDFLNAAFGASASSSIVFLDSDSSTSTSPDKQDLVYVTNAAIGDVPLPAAFWLLGGGLFAMFGLGRFRKVGGAA